MLTILGPLCICLTDFNFFLLEVSKTNDSELVVCFWSCCFFCLELNFSIQYSSSHHMLSIYLIPGMCTCTHSFSTCIHQNRKW